ncbi:hypothetical protein [Chitinophaga sp. OAE865]|uniref:hypothetical protein n=1 Tax=Chitinophaga sp. OAE865 TaxID=2817898 RepID=UPI001AEA4BF8
MKRKVLYNPFDRLTEAMIQYSISSGEIYWVIQRFEWPGVPLKKGFIVSRYKMESDAMDHSRALGPGEGKSLDISQEAAKITGLMDPDSGFHFFSNTLHKDWEKNLKAAFKDKFIAYIRQAHFAGRGAVEATLSLEYGRVVIELKNDKGQNYKVPISKILNA